MSSDTDNPRQRTVAELLAAHGDVSATGRRRRRREADGPDEGAPPPGGFGTATPDWMADSAEPDRSMLDDRAAPPPREGRRRAAPDPWESDGREPLAPAPQGWDSPPWASAGDDAPQRESRSQEYSGWEAQAREARTRSREAPAHDVQGWDDAEPQPWEQEQHPRESRSRELQRDAQPWDAQPRAQQSGSWEPQVEPRRAPERPTGGSPRGDRAAADPVPDRPTDKMPRVRDAAPSDVGLTAPIKQQRRRAAPEVADPAPDDVDGGPATVVGGAPAGAEAWHRTRTRDRSRPVGDDGGPPTQASTPLDFDDHPAGLGGRELDEADHADGRYDSGEIEPVDAPEVGEQRKGLGRVADSAGQAWAGVLAQWIIGAVGGAALWVGFRYLWRSLPVVALAAAVLVTVGLVVLVRALLRSNDLRTTLFAVLVGLLLTVSPAILVLMGR